MKFITNYVGGTRIVKKFAFLPITISSTNRIETRWLETVWIKQKRERGCPDGWDNIRFLNKNKKHMIDNMFQLNCSTLFLLHPLGINKTMLEGAGFINCYLKDPKRPEYEEMDVVYLLFKPRKPEKLKYLLDTEKARTPLFIDEYDLEDGYVVVVYEFPDALKEDFELFKEGKYSSLSQEFQKTVPKYTKVKGFSEEQMSFQYMVINKVEILRDLIEDDLAVVIDRGQELWQKPNITDETLVIPPKKIAR